jgi:tRNA (cytidine/uridine-2'-O-)-methyltransferase
MFEIVLHEPEIPPNTGNIIRLCANSGSRLHLIEPLGFELDDKRLRRAGLDYHEWADVRVHPHLQAFLAQHQGRLLAASTKCRQRYSDIRYRPGDALLFGPESRGLPADLLATLPAEHCLTIPMLPQSRSLNLANAVALVLYHAWSQLDFQGCAQAPAASR